MNMRVLSPEEARVQLERLFAQAEAGQIIDFNDPSAMFLRRMGLISDIDRENGTLSVVVLDQKTCLNLLEGAPAPTPIEVSKHQLLNVYAFGK